MTRSRERTEAALIAAARRMIEVNSYESIRVRDIADEVGCNHGLITQYFDTKLGLFTRVLQDLVVDIAQITTELSSPRMVLDHPTLATFWGLLAALLQAGLDPANALPADTPVLEVLLRRGHELAGTALEERRAIVGFVLLMIGGYHIFGEVLAPLIRPANAGSDPGEHFESFVMLVLKSLNNTS
jgi:AcrR family transcriptional regulator